MTEQSLVEKGFYGDFGGSYIPEDLQKVLGKLAETISSHRQNLSVVKSLHLLASSMPSSERAGIPLLIACLISLNNSVHLFTIGVSSPTLVS